MIFVTLSLINKFSLAAGWNAKIQCFTFSAAKSL